MKKSNKEFVSINVGGIKIIDKVTNVKTGEIKVYDRNHNLVVDSIMRLVTDLLKNKITGGIQYWAVGSGSVLWDSTPTEPEATETTLTNEIGRKAISPSDIIYVDSERYEVSDVPTNCLQITCVFYEEDCLGVWREFGLFGGNATSEKDSGYMIDKKHHDVMTKTDEMVVERKIILNIGRD